MGCVEAVSSLCDIESLTVFRAFWGLLGLHSQRCLGMLGFGVKAVEVRFRV